VLLHIDTNARWLRLRRICLSRQALNYALYAISGVAIVSVGLSRPVAAGVIAQLSIALTHERKGRHAYT
jgi:hypothetical protein